MLYSTDGDAERLILIAVENERLACNAEGCLDELALLAETSGAEVAGRLVQRREAVHPGHYLGKGKIEELKELAAGLNAGAVAADDELTAAQQRNIGKMLGLRVLDRTMLILDIFAGRAVSSEGKAQVELAQLRYRLSHLTGLGAQLSRQAGGGGIKGGGIGTRGPGEKKLETDRRHIRARIDQLNAELKEVRENRKVLRAKRERGGVPVIALVGYTNAGKSSLLNALTSAGVFVEDKLFATLDTTTRRVGLDGSEALLTDTVGFINKLPHHLIQAFRATLEELEYADILLHVTDCSNPAHAEQMAVVYDTLKALNCADKPVITAFNKIDKSGRPDSYADARALRVIPISAKTGENLPELLNIIQETIQSMRQRVNVLIPYQESRLVNLLHEKCEIITEEHREDGTYIEAYADSETVGRVNKYKLLAK